jgi:hypothetical protein
MLQTLNAPWREQIEEDTLLAICRGDVPASAHLGRVLQIFSDVHRQAVLTYFLGHALGFADIARLYRAGRAAGMPPSLSWEQWFGELGISV